MTATWQPTDVMFPDAETIITGAYRTLQDAQGETDVEVDREVPADRPPRLVAITRDGGTNDGLRDRPRMRFRIFDSDDAKANDLARLVVALSGRLVGDGPVLHREVLSGPFEVPDPGGPMRYALIEFHTRGEPLT